MRWEKQAVRVGNTWRPFGLVVGAVLSGLLLGIIIGLFSCNSSGTLSGTKEESYLVLAATLYGQGESLGAMKVYLKSFGPRDPGAAMLQLADKYEKSNDRKKEQQARDLRQLGESLKLGREVQPVQASATGSQAPGVTPTPPAPPSQPTSAAKPAAPTPTTAPAPQPTFTSGPAPTALSGQGVARPSNGGAIMREQPSTTSAMVGSLANGQKVEIVRVVEGEAVDTTERRWYLVKFGDKTGYVYFKLIASE
ncbi:MAG: SH3 domain-containing protein [Chloroflexi bacterium]|nr:SH3 domain-containing protein [Chloroflexota bacterium]